LGLGLSSGAELFGFMDDTLVVATSRSIAELQTTINESLSRVAEKFLEPSLSLAVEKTQAVFFPNKKKWTPPRITLNG